MYEDLDEKITSISFQNEVKMKEILAENERKMDVLQEEYEKRMILLKQQHEKEMKVFISIMILIFLFEKLKIAIETRI